MARRIIRQFSSEISPLRRLVIGTDGTVSSHVIGSTSNPLAFVTINELLSKTVSKYHVNLGLAADSQQMMLTWEDIESRVQVACRGLIDMGVEKGDRVGSWLPNLTEYIIMQYATARIGAVLVTLNPAYRENEFVHAVNKVGCKVILLTPTVATSDYASIVGGLDPSIVPSVEHILIAQLEARDDLEGLDKVMNTKQKLRSAGYNASTYSELMEASSISESSPLDHDIAAISADLSPEDMINIQFTSGTTGLPKAVALSHINVVNNARNVAHCLHLDQARDRLCIPVPMYHCFGVVMGSLACAYTGCAAVFPAPTFNPRATLTSVEKHKCTTLYGVPTMFITELAELKSMEVDLSSLRTGIMAGSVCPEQVMRSVMDTMHMDQVTIAYGMTETSPVSFQSSVNDPILKRCKTVGRVHPHVECKIVRQDGSTADINEPGELWTKGYSVMMKYYNDEAATKQAVTEDGWMKTGDLATFDEEGYCSIVGRIKDTIIRGGENIAPREVEDALFEHSAVENATVIGVPDPIFGETVCACVVLREKFSPQLAEDLKQHCKKQLAHFKVPKYFRFVNQEDIPMTVSGKVQKHILSKTSAQVLGLVEAEIEK